MGNWNDKLAEAISKANPVIENFVVPNTADEVLDFIGCNFIQIEETDGEDPIITLSTHDLISAFNDYIRFHN